MPTLVLKDVPAELHRRLKEEAEKAHRSMNGEAIYILESVLNELKSFSNARELPAAYRGKKPITDKLMDQWKGPVSFLAPPTGPRQGWTEAFERMARAGDDALLGEGGPSTEWSRKEWKW